MLIALSVVLPLLQHHEPISRAAMQFVAQAPGQQIMPAQVSTAAAAALDPTPIAQHAKVCCCVSQSNPTSWQVKILLC